MATPSSTPARKPTYTGTIEEDGELIVGAWKPDPG